MTHLNYDLESPIWRHWIEFLSAHFRVIRYDERGCGMTDWNVADLSSERWTETWKQSSMRAIPASDSSLLGISQGAAAAVGYAVRHPERVSRLVLYGGYSTGWAHREDSEGLRRYRAIIELARLGWGKDNPIFRQLFTSRFVPEARPEQIEWFNELCRRTTTPEIAARLLTARAEVNVSRPAAPGAVPTLVLHARKDEVVPFSAGKVLATEIPNAEFVELDSRNHILLADEPAWMRFKEAVLEFTGRPHAAWCRGSAVRLLVGARAADPRRAGRGTKQHRDRRFALHQREDRAQFADPDLREARRAHPHAGGGAGARSGLRAARRNVGVMRRGV